MVGAWQPETYVLKDGSRLNVDGLIFFTERDWTVLFFVTNEGGRVVRGSGEGGSYELEGDVLTFVHQYHLSSGEATGTLAASPLRMEVHSATDAAREPTRIALAGDRLVLFFPSGNSMVFKRR